MGTWADLPNTWSEWNTWNYGKYPYIPVIKMDLVSEDYNLNCNEEFIEIKNTGRTLSDKKLIFKSNNLTFQKLIDNDELSYDSTDYIVMTKEFLNYITLNESFTVKLLDKATGKYKLLINCKLSKTPNQSISASGNKEDISIDFEKYVDF